MQARKEAEKERIKAEKEQQRVAKEAEKDRLRSVTRPLCCSLLQLGIDVMMLWQLYSMVAVADVEGTFALHLPQADC